MKLTRLFLFLVAMVGGSSALAADEPVKVVYHLTNGIAEASRGLGNIRNHLDADPTARIIVVTNGNGIEFLLEGAKDAKGESFAGAIGALSNRGVEFRVCHNTLATREIPEDKVVMEAKVVPSGVAEAARLQSKEHFAYLRP